MPFYVRALYGLAAGFTLVIVRIVTAEAQALSGFYHSQNWLDFGAMLIVFVGMVFLGALGGLFSDATSRHGILMYCAALPGILSTAVAAQQYDPPRKTITSGPASEVSKNDKGKLFEFSFISTARAQENIELPANDHTCSEKYSFADFSTKVISRFSGEPLQTYDLIVASKSDINAAFETARQLAEETGLQFSVGCRMPNNEYYPVLVGQDLPLTSAFELKSEFLQRAPNSEKPYLSNYAFRTEIDVTAQTK